MSAVAVVLNVQPYIEPGYARAEGTRLRKRLPTDPGIRAISP